MLSEEQIFNMSENELEEKIKLLNQVHITMKKKENPNMFSRFDYGGVKQDILSDKKLLINLEKLELHELINNLNSEDFYKLVEPILGSIIHRNIGRITNGYQLENMEIQTSLPLCIQFLVGDESPSNEELVPHTKEVEELTYGELEEKIFESILCIKYMLNKGQCGQPEYLYIEPDDFKKIKSKYDFYSLNKELKLDENKKLKKIKI